MINQLKIILSIIPEKFRKKLPFFVSLSFLNLLLDLISIAYLIPVFLLLIDYKMVLEKASEFIQISESNIPLIVVLFIVSFIVKNLIQIRINTYQSHFIFNIATKLSSKFLNNFLTKNYLDFQKKNTAKSIQNIKIVGLDFSNHILLSINTFLTEGIVVFIILGIGIYFYLKLTLIVLGIFSLAFIFLIFQRKKKIIAINDSLKSSYHEVTSQLINIIQGFLELKSLNKELHFYKKFNKSVHHFNNQYAKLEIYKKSNNKYLEILMVVGLTFVVLFLIQAQNSTISNVFVISFIAGSALKLLPSINKIIVSYTNFQSFKYTIDILSEVVNLNKNTTIINTPLKKNFILKDVSFQYSSKKRIIDNVNLTILKGEVIGISGDSGTGKTTFVNIIMNLQKPQKGAVFIDDFKICNEHNLFGIINYLPQNSFIFEGSIIDNITLGEGEKNIDFKKIHKLSEILELDSIIKSEEKLYLDINSLKISGGQKQRIALLRSLYHNFDILILDEATNQLDEKLEERILNYLVELKKEGKTIIMISHNPKMKKISDKYYVLKDRKLVMIK
ncbi:hypothetical protein BA195_04660 [Tenacibaculum soleae]|uniref:ABC transporter ATP-binding protein n=1 Tax=Tenacibaculum soleae TaxID=447689 RepID=A0A1B9Y2R9_9FLAO|nr:ATP-binding cassette domain-containing protein [Tenacibaculum soleae]OCK43991.1 hypothetical protein BA195_04660 [Tenacibaculum soleae]